MLFVGWVDCLDPTQITLEITTDVKCADLHETSIAIGGLSQLEAGAPSATTGRCDPSTGQVGSLVVVPSGMGQAAAVRVVAAFGGRKTADECVATGFKGGCIVARRVVSYVSHTRLRLPIRLEAACADVPCDATETCLGGRCVPATVDCDPVLGCVPSGDAAVVQVQRSFGGAGDDWVSALTHDANGNLYAGGMISGQVDLGRGVLSAFASGSPLQASFDASLASRWAYAPSVTVSSGARAVAVGGASAYVAGSGTGIDFGMGPTADGGFVAATALQDGKLQAGQALAHALAYSVAADDQGKTYVGGVCAFGTGTIGGKMCPAGTAFLAAFTGSSTSWVKLFGGTTSAGSVAALALAGTHLYAGGNFGEAVDFGGGPVPTGGSSDAFVASYRASDGAYEWARAFGGPQLQVVHSLAVDAASVWVAGDMSGSLTAGTTLTAAGLDDVFLLRLDPSGGVPLLARRFGGANEESGRSVAVDAKGNAWLCGWFQIGGDFGAGYVASKGNIDAFVVSVGPDGTVRMSRTFGGTGNSQCMAITTDGPAYYLGGVFDGSLDFGLPALKSAGKHDAFLVKLPQ